MREKNGRAAANQKDNNDRHAISPFWAKQIGAVLFQDCFVGRPNGFVGWRGFVLPERSEVGRTGTLASLCSGALNLAAQRTRREGFGRGKMGRGSGCFVPL